MLVVISHAGPTEGAATVDFTKSRLVAVDRLLADVERLNGV